MGADLYIEGAIKSLHEELNPLFEDAVHARNKIEDKDSKEFKDASDKVHSIYNDMYPTDLYFRDSYKLKYDENWGFSTYAVGKTFRLLG